MSHTFHFQQFSIRQDRCPMKVGTDGVLLGAWPEVLPNTKVLDIGTGTGLIALMLAQKEERAQVTGVEIDKIAAKQAIENVSNSPFAERTSIQLASIQEFSQNHAGLFDLIVSNPPFFTGGVLSDNMERRHVRHTVKLSHQDLLRSVQLLLKEGGRFCVVLPWIEGLRFQEIASEYRLCLSKKCAVSSRPNRVPNRLILEFTFGEALSDVVFSEMSIYAHTKGNEYSAAFLDLTKDYYKFKSPIPPPS